MSISRPRPSKYNYNLKLPQTYNQKPFETGV